MEKQEDRRREGKGQRKLRRNGWKKGVEKMKKMKTKRRDGGWCRRG
jgi:hypothetical protein